MISTKIIKPAQCAIGFGIPTSKTDFEHDLARQDKDFANKFKAWSIYKDQVVDHFIQLKTPIEQLGVCLVEQLTLEKFRNLFLNDAYDVIILFSHWKSKTVEFYDGLKTISDIIDAVPLEFSGIIDLCVCHPTELRIRLDKERPNCVVKFSTAKSLPLFWLNFYDTLFTYLQQYDAAYADAAETVLNLFQQSTKGAK